MIIFDNLFLLSLHGHCLCSLDLPDLLVPQSQSSIIIIIVQHGAYASVEVEPGITRHCFDPVSILSDFIDKSHYYFPNLNVSGKTGSETNFVTYWISLT